MRLLAFVVFLITLAATGLAGQALWQEWQAPEAAAPPDDDAASTPGTVAAEPPAPPRRWPALFGEKQPPAPPAPEPQPPEADLRPSAPPAPPLSSLGYELKGVVRSGGTVWALVSHPAGERILRVGDDLEAGLMVMDIVEEGVWIGPEGGDADLLGFPD